MFFENGIDLYDAVINDLLTEKTDRDETEKPVDKSAK